MLVREGIKADSQSEEIDFLSKLPLRSINQKPFIVLLQEAHVRCFFGRLINKLVLK